jgi:predicted MFS family arabinose efflux permease
MRPSTALGWYLFSIISHSPWRGLKSPACLDCQRHTLSQIPQFNVPASITSAASLPRKTPTRAIMLLAVAGFASQAQVRVTDSLLPQIAGDFHTTVGAAAMVVTSYAIAHGSIQLIIGPFGDRLGKYRAVAVMCAIGTVLVALCGIASSLPQLALTRLATGAAAGWIIPISMAYIGDVTPYEARQPILGRYLTGQILGQLFGQAAGGVLGDLVGWRNVFFVLSGMFALATVGLAYELFTNPLTREPSHPNETTRGFVTDYVAVLTTPFARIVIIAAFIENALLWGAFAYIGAYLRLRFGLSFTLIGLTVGCFGIGGLIYAASVKLLVLRLGQVRLAIAGGFSIASGYIALCLAPVWWLTPIGTILIGLGFYMLHNTMQTNATQMTPQARGTAVALFSSSIFIGQTAGVATGALVIDRLGAVPLFLAAAAALPVLALWFARELKRYRRVTRPAG